MVSLRKKQSLFASLVPRLIDKAISMGYEVTLGDAFRDPRLHGALGVKLGYGHSKSGHKIRLAIDLNLFKDGKFLTDGTGHTELGKWWKAQHPDCRWGGDFAIKDYNHYSFFHDGVS